MVIGIQTNSRLPLPGTGDPLGAPGRSLSERTAESASEPEGAENPPSPPAAGQPAIVQLNFSGARALSRARLAGDRPAADANIFSQSEAAPTVQPEAAPAAGAEALRARLGIPQTLDGLSQALSPSLLDTTFIRATTDLAVALLAGGAGRPARVVPLASAEERSEI